MNKGAYLKLLDKAITKQNQLFSKQTFCDELLRFAYPILWFGNSISEKPRILTLGANPSRREYIDTKKIDIKNLSSDIEIAEGYFGSKARFCTGDTMNSTDSQTIAKINDSFDKYFEVNPYTQWFGNKATAKHSSSKVEAFLNGLDASYYDTKDLIACHIDLFPFATIRDFKKIENAVARELFNGGWAKDFLLELVDALDPKYIIIIGKTNCNCFEKYIANRYPKDTPLNIDGTTLRISYKDYGTKSIFTAPNLEKVIGISTNLGNPMASDGTKNIGIRSEDLITLGSQIKSILL